MQEHLSDRDYAENHYRLLPFVGTRQPTLQSATWNDGRLTTDHALPPEVDKILEGGDGTVPRYSAVPEEIDNEFRETFLAEKHGSLQASPIILQDVLGRLQQMQVPHIKKIRGPEITAEGSAISLDLEDIYLPEESVRFQVRLVNDASDADTVTGEIARVNDPSNSSQTVEFQKRGGLWEGHARDLNSGMYAIEVRTQRPYPLGPPPVHDIFAVA